MTTTTKPTAGAMRAGITIRNECHVTWKGEDGNQAGSIPLAEIIDRETGCGEMLAALELAQAKIAALSPPNIPLLEALMPPISLAIARAREGQ